MMPNIGRHPNFRSVEQLLEYFYGGGFVTQPIESTYTIGTTPASLGSTPGGVRVGLMLSNTGATNFAIGFAAGVAITTGALILPGGTYNLDWYYDGDLVSRVLYAVSSAAGGTLYMVERFLTGG